MQNREIYQMEPKSRNLVNDGVATVNDDNSRPAQDILRYELETFVCEGQYATGMAAILETFLQYINQPQQPGVWVSGFFGSGKSHFVKMLRALWTNDSFADGSTPRGLANLTQDVKDCLKELDVQGKKAGGLHAASGTLGSSASGSVRLALLSIIFKSAGLPRRYSAANFALWLKREGIYDDVKSHVLEKGKNWEYELDEFYVSSPVREALISLRPAIFNDPQTAREVLKEQFPQVADVSSDEMILAIRKTLEKDGKFPLTLIVLDEVQQYIGEDSQRSIAVQEVAEALGKNFAGRLLFIGTGQTAITGTPNLKKLEGRFTQRIELSDADVDSVIRKVILAKKPDAIQSVEDVLSNNNGEISRHLANTAIAHRQEDNAVFSQDYPLLPTRRRFWENTLRVLDQTGTDSQLRNQLSLVHRVISANQDESLGHVPGADYIYFDSADKLQQSRILPRSLYEFTSRHYNGSDEDKLLARACGLVFIINKLAVNKELGLAATVDTIADLLVEDLNSGSATLRATLPKLLDNCEQLDKIDNTYHIRTSEGIAWNNDFMSRRAALANDSARVSGEREARIGKMFKEIAGEPTLSQGKSMEGRRGHFIFGSQLPHGADKSLSIWIRDGWNANENSVEADARQAGGASSVIFVFIPKHRPNELRSAIIDFVAASSALDSRGNPSSPEGMQARGAMESRKSTAEAKIREIVTEAIANCRVFQGGGNEIATSSLREAMLEGMENALQRLYPQFSLADNPAWSKVYEQAKKGDPDALKPVGDNGDATNNTVCKKLLACLGQGRKGADIRQQFQDPPYGWPGDAIDGGLMALLAAGAVRAQAENGQDVTARTLERKAIGKTTFRMEAATVGTAQRIAIRKLLQKVGLHVQQGEELAQVGNFLDKMVALAEQAGGDAPRPVRPDTGFLDEIRNSSGNSLLLAIYDRRDQIGRTLEDWTRIGQEITLRMPAWKDLNALANHAAELPKAETFRQQIAFIEQRRELLAQPDPLTPLIAALAQILREELNRLVDEYNRLHKQGMESLRNNADWQKLTPEQRNKLMAANRLDVKSQPLINVGTNEEILATLERDSLASLANAVDALPSRFLAVARGTVEMNEPQTQFVHLPRRMLKTEADIDAWLDETRRMLNDALQNGPVMLGGIG